ncbi:MAG: hypothetical protein HY094_08915 [Candidatus Melainabacteria bacterium]|nr:hypothetical protein [Candidatus Melainabacteria bacterium]
MLLLSIYNITFLLLCVLFTDDMKIAFLLASAASLITMFLITMSDMFQVVREKEARLHDFEADVSKKIRDEYRKAHTLNQKKQLLLKTGFFNPEESENPSPSLNGSLSSKEDNINHERKVRLSYLNRTGTNSLPGAEEGGQHQGS